MTATSRPCPTCGAGIGDPCRDRRFFIYPHEEARPTVKPHRARRAPRENRPNLTPEPNRPTEET